MPRPPWSAVTTEPAIAGEAAPLCHERQRHRRRLSFYIAAQQAAYRYPNKAASPRSSLPRALQNEGSISFRRCIHDTVSADPTDSPPEAPAPSHHFYLQNTPKSRKGMNQMPESKDGITNRSNYANQTADPEKIPGCSRRALRTLR